MLEDKNDIIEHNRKFLSKYQKFQDNNGVVQLRDNKILVSFPFSKRELQKMIVLVLRYDQGKGSSFVSLKNIDDLSKLVDMIDPSRYYNDKVAMDHLDFIKVIIPLVKEGFSTEDIIYRCKQEMDDNYQNNVLKEIEFMMSTYLTTVMDSKAFINSLYEYLQFSSVLIFYKSIEEDLYELDIYKLKPEDPCKKIIKQAKKLIKRVNKFKVEEETGHEFNLDKQSMQDIVQYLIDEEKNNSYGITTGIKALNYMIIAFLPGRLYIFLAGSGVFKTNMLLLVAYWAKIYNKIQTRDKTKKPAILFISNENSVEENYERLFSIAGGKGTVGIHTQVEVLETFKKVGFEMNDENPTQVFFLYRGYNTISTDDIRDIIDEFRELYNYEVRMVVLDYMKRLRPVHEEKDERIKLGNISNDLKKLAVDYHIPVITAQQTNRAANVSVKEAKESNKRDLGKVNHQTGVAQSWDIIENADCVLSLTVQEKCPEDGGRYLCIYELKKRYKGFADYDYFEHPFVKGSKINLVEDIYDEKSSSRLEYDLRSSGFIPDDFIDKNQYYKKQVKDDNKPNWEDPKKKKSRPDFKEYMSDEPLAIDFKEGYDTNIQALLSKIYYDIDVVRASRYINQNIRGERKMKDSIVKYRDVQTEFYVMNASIDYYDLMKFAERKRATELEKKKLKKKREQKKREKKEKILDYSPVSDLIDTDNVAIIKKKDKKTKVKSKKHRNEVEIGDYILYTSNYEIDSDEVKKEIKSQSKYKKDKGFFEYMPFMDLDYSISILDSLTDDDITTFEDNIHKEWASKKYKSKVKKVIGGGRSLDGDYIKEENKKIEKEYQKQKKKERKNKEWDEWYSSLDENYIPPKKIEFVPYGLNHTERKHAIDDFNQGEELCNQIGYPKHNKFAKKVIKAYKKFFKYLDDTVYSALYGKMSNEAKNHVIDKIFEKYNKIQNIIWKEIIEYEKFIYDGEQLYTDCPNPFLVGVERKIKIIDSLFYSMKKIDKLKKKYVVYDFSISKKEAKKLDKIRIKNIKLMRDCLLGTFFSRTRDGIADSIEISKLLHKYERKQIKKYDGIRKGLANYEVQLDGEGRKQMAELREAQRRLMLKEAEKHIKSKYGDIPVQYFDEEVQQEILGHKVPTQFYQNLEYNTALENLEDLNDNWKKNQVFCEMTGRRGNTFPEFKDRHKGIPSNSLSDYASAIADYGATPEELERDYPGCYDQAVENDNKRWRKVYQRLKAACEAAERIRIGNDEDILEDKLDDIINAELDKIDSETVEDWRKERDMISTDRLDDIARFF